MAVQQCLVFIKPDGVVKSLIGEVITAFSQAKLKIVASKVVKVSKELAQAHYSELKQAQIKKHGEKIGTEIYDSTMCYIQGEYHIDRVFVMVYEGENVIEKIREIAGSTNPENAEITTIRGKYGRIHSKTGVMENVLHCSDSEANAKREIQLWFEPEELTSVIYPTKKEKVSMDKIVWA